eukprot:scaffold10347_cov96-Skeletonema_marinoi.AAC.3
MKSLIWSAWKNNFYTCWCRPVKEEMNDIVKIVVEIGTIMENVVDIALPQAAKRLCGHDNFYDSHRRGAFSTSTAL